MSSQTKAAFTRSYNKEVHMTPYATGTMSKKKRGGGAGAEDMEGYGEEGEAAAAESEEEEEGLENDTMIKVSRSGIGQKKICVFAVRWP